MDRRLLLALTVALAVAVAGCGGAGETGLGDSADGPEPQAASGGDDGGGAAGGGDGGGDSGGDAQLEYTGANGDAQGGGAAAQVDRALIMTGTVRLEVENFSTARQSVESNAAAYGGYIAASDATRHRDGEDTWRTGYLVVRVPSSNFSSMVASAEGQGIVISSSSETEDVTDQLVDLNARLENLRAERDRLRTFYEEANTTEELLQVEERLSEVQGEIERLEARKRSLEDRVAYSTLRVELQEPVPGGDSAVDPRFHEQSPLEAFSNSVALLVVVARTLFIFAVAATPWLLVLAVPVVVVGVLVRRFTRFG